jgi:hypothetical protein
MKKLIILLALTFSHQAFSKWFADIHVGFGFVPDTDDNEKEIVFEGMETGIRFGLGHRILIFGFDGSYGWMNADFPYISTTDSPMKKYDLGVFVGLEFQKLFRVWASYFPKSEWNFSSTGSPKLEGTAFGGGFGMTVLPYVTFNGEIKFYNMNILTVSENSTTWTGDAKIKPYELIFSLGFIF